MLKLALESASLAPLFSATAITIITTIIIVTNSNRIKSYIYLFIKPITSLPCWIIFTFGLVIRIVWILAFPAQPGSDGAVYLKLAQSLKMGDDYEIAGTLAYWPVGYPLFLVPWLFLFANTHLAYLFSNLVIFSITIFGIKNLAFHLSDSKGSKLAMLIFSIWPNLIFNVSTPEKEMLVLALLPWAIWFIIKTSESSSFLGYTNFIFAGFILGFTILVQPSFQLLPLVICLLLFTLSGFNKTNITKVFLFCLSAAFVIAPWTLRNYKHFDQFILVSTNGGDVFYRANNELATGGYTAYGQVNLNQLNEIERDKQGKKLAFEWITSNPIGFIKLIFQKQIRFLGDDSVGVYNTLKVGQGSNSATLYIIFKAIANLWWITVWIILSSLALELLRNNYTISNFSAIPLWIYTYLFIIHSVFESAGKYHAPLSWAICILIQLIHFLEKDQSLDFRLALIH